MSVPDRSSLAYANDMAFAAAAANMAIAGDLAVAGDAPSRASFAINVTPVERILRRSPVVAVGEYRCPIDHPQFAGGGPQACPYIAFSRTSVRIAPLDARPEVRTPNSVSLYNVGDVYARHPVSAEGDRCDWIAIDPRVMRDIGERHDPSLEDERRKIFAAGSAPTSARLYLTQRALFQSLHDDPHLSMLEVEECAIRIVEEAYSHALQFWPARRTVKRRRRFDGRAPAMVDAARAILAREYGSALGIGDIAGRVHCSPGYLSRLFRDATGFSLHGYQQQLRLRASLEMLVEARRDLSALAVYLGYANHSHFTSVFRHYLGITPTEFARRRSLRQLRDLESTLSGIESAAAARAVRKRA